MAARRTAGARASTAKGLATTTTTTRARAPKIKEATRTGIMAVLRRLGEEHPSWGDIYREMLPEEKKELVGELAVVFENG